MLAGAALCWHHAAMSVASKLLLPLLLASAPPVHASAQLALDKGCYSCHGEPPRRSAPSIAQLAADYARYRGQAEAPRKLADKLREGGLFAHIVAHERLSPAECETLMRWLIDGAK
jgi:cytochrome c